MKIISRFSEKNDCYQRNLTKADSRYTRFQERGPLGLMLHSVGTPQPDASVFAGRWNRAGTEVAVHAVLQADGTVYQCLPWNYRGWHAGGSANDTHVGVEMTEPACIRYTGGSTFTCSDPASAQDFCRGTWAAAVELFAKLCRAYDLDPMTAIISHAEGAKQGIASNHGDPEHYWNQLKTGYTMDGFRKAVKAKMGNSTAAQQPAKVDTKKTTGEQFLVKIRVPDLNIRGGAGLSYPVKGVIPVSIYTIVETKIADGHTWGKLKSGAGWIALEYTVKLEQR